MLERKDAKVAVCNEQWWDCEQTHTVMCNYPSGCPIFFLTFVTLKCFKTLHSASSDDLRSHLNRVCLTMRPAEISKINKWIQHNWHLTVWEGLQCSFSGFGIQTHCGLTQNLQILKTWGSGEPSQEWKPGPGGTALITKNINSAVYQKLLKKTLCPRQQQAQTHMGSTAGTQTTTH